MLLWMFPTVLKPSHMVSMFAEDEKMVVFKLCSCCSTPASFERGLEGALADLRWKAMLRVEALMLCLESRREEKIRQDHLRFVGAEPWLPSIYNRETEEMA